VQQPPVVVDHNASMPNVVPTSVPATPVQVPANPVQSNSASPNSVPTTLVTASTVPQTLTREWHEISDKTKPAKRGGKSHILRDTTSFLDDVHHVSIQHHHNPV